MRKLINGPVKLKGIKGIKKYAKNAYKKAPKKKIINKAATYGFKQVIGGPYLDIINHFYKKTRKKAISYAGSYAYESFFRSNFAREKINTLPISIIALIIRLLTNFLLFSSLKIGIYWIDFIISVTITIIITLLSPLFYISVKAHEEDFMRYTNIIIDNSLEQNGHEYMEDLKNKILFIIGIIFIILLQFIEINSRYLQEIIIHSLITGFISNELQKWLDGLTLPKITDVIVENIPESKPKYIIPAKISQHKINYCHTDNIIFKTLHPIRAEIISRDKLKDYIIIEMANSSLLSHSTEIMSIIDDYFPTD